MSQTATILFVLWLLASTIYVLCQLPPKMKFSGMTYTNGKYCPNITFDSSVSDDSLYHLSTIGTNYVSIIVSQYQMTHLSTDIFPIYGEPVSCTSIATWPCITATPDALKHAINKSHSLGMGVMLKPQIDLLNDTGFWRGNIGQGMDSNNAFWTEWFDTYSNYILFYAQIAQETNVEILCVSTELIIVAKQENLWRELIPKIRNIYGGELTSDAKCGEEAEVNNKWWDILDYIGISEYCVYASVMYPSLNQVINAWTTEANKLLSLSKTWNKSVILSEIGYCSGINGSCYCNGNVAPQAPDNASMQNMKIYYEGAMIAMTQYDWFEGMFWWNWVSDNAMGGLNDSCMTPAYKPTEGLLRQWYRASEPSPPPPNYPVLCECWL